MLESDSDLDPKTVLTHLDEINGIDRNGKLYLEFPFFVENYSQHDSVMKDSITGRDLERLVHGNGNRDFLVQICDYPC